MARHRKKTIDSNSSYVPRRLTKQSEGDEKDKESAEDFGAVLGQSRPGSREEESSDEGIQLARRRWDPPGNPRKSEAKQKGAKLQVVGARSSTPTFSALAAEPSDDERSDVNRKKAMVPERGTYTRSASLTFRGISEMEAEARENNARVFWEEVIASKVLTSLYLMQSNLKQDVAAAAQPLPNAPASPLPPSSPPAPASPLPPSSPPAPSSPYSPVRRRVVPTGRRRDVSPVRGFVSPGEWETPGSPLPMEAYERMPWTRLFKRWRKGGQKSSK
ncbi:hypothetical protein C8R43DRAFT_963672 [Mycena crocata]|nr:hypothetical protein C8R43DRAFT_963672 [Mycena crocata]